MKKSFQMRPLTTEDAAAAAAFMKAQPDRHTRYFYAFAADQKAIAEMLSKAEKDVYSGIFWQDELIGVFMLRGWDEGYEIPSYGVFIDEKYRGRCLFELTITAARLICQLSGTKKALIKLHSGRITPKGAKRLGLYEIGFEESTGNITYHIDI